MFKKLLEWLGLGAATEASVLAGGLPAPYADDATNSIYNLLFCDEPALWKPKEGKHPAYWQSVLCNENADPKAVAALADSEIEESRTRVLAYNWLRKHNHPVPRGKLFGVIVEVGMEGGLDVLATYEDRSIRLIGRTGRMAFFEAVPSDMEPKIAKLLSAAQVAVDRIGPWYEVRLPPPTEGNVRLSFLVSDGLYFGEGPFELMQREPMAGPIIQEATELFRLVVKFVTECPLSTDPKSG
jgi:hypothetical protein